MTEQFPPPGPAGPGAPPPGGTPPRLLGSAPSPAAVGDGPGRPGRRVRPRRRSACSAPHTSPGAVPLRPLSLGDMYDAAFRIIRFNPKATVGSAVLVAAVAMAIPVVVTALLTWSVDLSLDAGTTTVTGADVGGLVGALGSLRPRPVLQTSG